MYRLNEENDKAKLEALREQCPDRELLELKVTIKAKEIVVYARCPNRAMYKRFRAKGKLVSANDALEELVSANILHPLGAEVAKLFERYPGLIDTFGESLFEAMGLSQTAESELKNY